MLVGAVCRLKAEEQWWGEHRGCNEVEVVGGGGAEGGPRGCVSAGIAAGTDGLEHVPLGPCSLASGFRRNQ